MLTARGRWSLGLVLLAMIPNCSRETPVPVSKQRSVFVLLDTDGADDKSFNEFTRKGAEIAAKETGLAFSFLTSPSTSEYERLLESTISSRKPDLVVTVGFLMSDATAKVARRHPAAWFAGMDTAYFPGFGCPERVKDCYSKEGGLTNVTSLVFAEDQVAYLAGVLAGCMTKSGIVAVVAGREIPPVVRYVTGFQTGALSFRSDLTVFHRYIPDFGSPMTGKLVGQGFIQQGADVVFAPAGKTGTGALESAKEAGIMAIGVDVDQYETLPVVREVLVTSASKKVDLAVAALVRDFAAGNLEAGIRRMTLRQNAVGLAPFHDWEERIPDECKEAIAEARRAILADPSITDAD